MSRPGARDEQELFRAGQSLDPPFQLKGAAPSSHPARPGEAHGAARTGEF
jgi:hypothetical protein